MATKKKTIKSKNWSCDIIYHQREDSKELVKKIKTTIKDRQKLIDLIEQKKQLKRELLSTEIKVMNNCISSWKATIKECEKKLIKLKSSSQIK